MIVIEAAAKSGSLITARNALDQGRDVYAVPGHPFDARASGCNMLIRDGAVLVRKGQDVIDALSSGTPATTTKSRNHPARSGAAFSQILAALASVSDAAKTKSSAIWELAHRPAGTIVDLKLMEKFSAYMVADCIERGPFKTLSFISLGKKAY